NWSADSPEIISIEAGSSLVSGLDIGSSSLSAELDGHNAASTVTVSNAVLSNISILPINSSLPKGLSQSFSAQGTYSDGSVQDITEQVTWTSSDSAIGSISNAALSEGLVNGLELGFVNISATLDDISISTSLSIQDAVLTAIEVQPGNISLANGLQIQAIALGSYSDGEQIDISKEANWNTSSSTVASVESPSAPVISANAEGEALISAELEGISGISLVTVTSATLQSISLTSDNTSIPAGFTEQVKASGLYTDASTKDITHLVTWQSEDNQLITVDNNVDSPGLIRTVAPGSTRVSASFEGLSSSATFTVTDAILSSIAITSPASAINVNDELQLSAIADYSDNSSKDLTQEV
ncbi:Ig-like domain-containing protein, partial [Oleiphilus sp. HI0086]